ncbi:MAG: T9SS type A sorting domain-containing protein, partial [Winogradskyella sp.]|nr:T9SS type A sorting domain-containing protein [Winogradskyella sp.]
MYSAQAFPFTEDLKIPLVVDIEQQQPLRFRIFDIQNFEEAQGIYIHDKENDTYVNLRNLNYELNIEPGHYTDRFEIVFTSESSLDVDGFDMNTLTINQNNGVHQLSVLNPKNLNISAIEVYDISGKRLLHGAFDTILNRYEFSTIDLSDGVYIVNVTSNTSAVKSQKIIVKN